MSDFFNQALLRLKERTGLQNNKDVAALLGMQEKAFTARKARGSFPETELYALAAKRPDLAIDVDYVLTGEHAVPAKPAWLRLKAQLGFDDDEAVADWLDMDVPSASAYTRRGVFPVQQFLEANEKDGGSIDEDYVLKGVPSVALEMIDGARRGLPYMQVGPEEQLLLARWHSCSADDQALLLGLLMRLTTKP